MFTSELDGYFKPAVKAYLSHSVINWNEFISEFWRQFRDTTSQSKATDRLMQATQQKNQRVHQFITWVKNTASKAGVIDTKVLGRLVYKGVLPEIIKASKTTIPEGGLTLEEASAWALDAEKAVDQVSYSLNSRSGDNNNNKNKRKTDDDNNLVATITEPSFKKNTPPSKDHNKKPRVENTRKPMGTPTGILYLITNLKGGSSLHPNIKKYRETKNLCLRCGAGTHAADDCKVNLKNTDKSLIRRVAEDFEIKVPLNIIKSEVKNNRMVLVELYNRATQDYSKHRCLIDTGAFRNYLDYDIAVKLNLMTRKHPLPYNAVGADGSTLAHITQQAMTPVKFNTHVSNVTFDIMHLGNLQCVLGWVSSKHTTL